MRISMDLMRMTGVDNSERLKEARARSMERSLRNLRRQQEERKAAERSSIVLAVRS